MRRPVITFAATLAAAGLALTACSSGGGGGDATDDAGAGDGTSAGEATPDATPVTITLTWWGNEDRAAMYEEAVDLFEEKYPYITVQTSWQAFSDYWTARNTEAAGSALPDVMQFDSTFLREYAQSGRLLDLTELVADGDIDLSGVDPALVDGVSLDGETLGIPTGTNTLGMFVNPTVLEQVGLDFPADGYTWEEYNDYVQQVADAGVKTADGYQIYGSGDYTGTFWFFLQWLVQQGVEPFTDDGQIGFTQDDVVTWLDSVKDLRDGGAFFPVDRNVALSPKGGFTVNEVGSEASWDNFLATYTAETGTDSLELVPIWSGEDGTQNFFRAFMMAAGANTEHPEATALLLNFFASEPEVGAIFGTSKGIPADEEQRAAVDAPEGSVDAKVIAYEEAVRETGSVATAPIPVLGFGTVEEKWKQLGEELDYGTITAQEFAEQWFAEAELAVG
ncbi:extracellular solute-binding protein [Miniimonas arenae]|uniref:Extracellular solute-binding protein n=1 Tax=Miniimonas arenae TaxID=676201 RepID=A0A5C5B9U5_9MICO|nr:extracellular solute-binding protein [Miniimonas arenae]TNU73600.1 extracellular solute-binding protein [Miniimonas arenae]